LNDLKFADVIDAEYFEMEYELVGYILIEVESSLILKGDQIVVVLLSYAFQAAFCI
jgi:hypothetical protein